MDESFLGAPYGSTTEDIRLRSATKTFSFPITPGCDQSPAPSGRSLLPGHTRFHRARAGRHQTGNRVMDGSEPTAGPPMPREVHFLIVCSSGPTSFDGDSYRGIEVRGKIEGDRPGFHPTTVVEFHAGRMIFGANRNFCGSMGTTRWNLVVRGTRSSAPGPPFSARAYRRTSGPTCAAGEDLAGKRPTRVTRLRRTASTSTPPTTESTCHGQASREGG